jgi:hypothetical protein
MMTKIWRLLICIGAFFICHISPAQTVVIGATSDDVAKVYGQPVGFLWRGVFYKEAPTITTGEIVFVVYRQKDDLNEYEFRISYTADTVLSRFNPIYRVSTITLITDKPIQIRGMINRLGWAKDFCQPRCKVRRIVPGVELLLIPDKHLTDWQAWTLQIYYADQQGQPMSNAMSDLDGEANVFQLSRYDYTTFPLTRSVKNGWTVGH